MRYLYLSDLIKKGIDLNPVLLYILELTLPTKKSYPYVKWFLEKHVPGIYGGNRDTILCVFDHKIIGVANVKRGMENKICTLYVEKKFRKNRCGIELVRKACEFLGTSHPLITMPSDVLKDYKTIIKLFEWKLTDQIVSCYKEGVVELVFNEELKTEIPLQKDLNFLQFTKKFVVLFFAFGKQFWKNKKRGWKVWDYVQGL